MASGNALHPRPDVPETTSGNRVRQRGRAPLQLPTSYDHVLAEYMIALERAPLEPATRAKYLSRVRGFLAWLAETDVDGDPLVDPAARDWAVRDYRGYLKAVRKSAPSTINTTLAALGDFYGRRGLGAAAARREYLPERDGPRALSEREARRYLREVEQEPSARDRVVALLPYYAGLRGSEVVRLDVDDVRLSARRGEVRVLGKGSDGGKLRTLPVHAQLRAVLQPWLEQRRGWPAVGDTPALVLNRRGGRLSDRSGRAIIERLGQLAGLDDDSLDPFGPHVLRHTFGTQLVRAGVDLVTVAELMGHARLETTRIYTRPTKADRDRALDALITDR
ncbi:MAG: tyrosine-type recombinase/integrase [Candidatus Dormibacteraeota bacterium]|nr:tyrosine-type recombinase/integrase [Candidatus Dormibacteraeota bacterium]